jgi:hypothetical protein
MLRRAPIRRKPHEPSVEPRERHPVALKPSTVRGVYGVSVSGVAVPKSERAPGGKAEHEHKAALVALGCMACRRLFPYLAPVEPELHHLRGGGWGKGDWKTLFGLCFRHHRGEDGIHTLGTKAWERKYSFTQADLLMEALTLVNQLGASPEGETV